LQASAAVLLLRLLLHKVLRLPSLSVSVSLSVMVGLNIF